MTANMTAETTVEAKLAFERICSSYGTTIQHYHADNGLFDTKLFRSSIEKANQSLSFCGVNAHHQNGKAKNRIKDITQGACTALLHAHIAGREQYPPLFGLLPSKSMSTCATPSQLSLYPGLSKVESSYQTAL
mmetsp:Transcript_15936/g.23133  ORF Transcript_15936/g.23133 Transcript_15936/m.23133 type:complete len:133 (+) Transcript_15936:837-1235(+)